MHGLVDFHCHSNFTDGELSPSELAKVAIDNDFKYFAITDHDCIDSQSQLKQCLQPSNVQFISGVELSSHWNKIGVHVVGLKFDVNDESLLSLISSQKTSRLSRAKQISNRLEKVGLKNGLGKIQEKQGVGSFIGRPDFAKLLVDEKIVKDQNQAFKKYLGSGKIGDVKSHWPNLEAVVQAIVGADGLAVLAHPLHYKLTNAKLKRLIKSFQLCGGEAIEVISGFQNKDKINYIQDICKEMDLIASIGSDFHFKKSWKKLGCQMSLIDGLDPIWNHFAAK